MMGGGAGPTHQPRLLPANRACMAYKHASSILPANKSPFQGTVCAAVVPRRCGHVLPGTWCAASPRRSLFGGRGSEVTNLQPTGRWRSP